MKVDLKTLCGKQTVSREDGLVVAKTLLQAMKKGDIITIDFNNILIASVSFLDEALGKLAFKYPREVLAKKLDFKNMESFDRALLNDILISRYHQKDLEQKRGRKNELHKSASGL